MIRTLASSLTLALMLAGPALAQDKQQEPSKKQAAQQQRMKSCNAQASKKDLKGRERQSFMSECLSADSAAGGSPEGESKMNVQQARMKSCNAQASKKGMKGDERKAFMSGCLKAAGSDSAAGGSPEGESKLTVPQARMKACNAQASKKGMKGDERKAFMSECLKDKS